MTAAIRTDQLSKHFFRLQALDRLTLEVPEGAVYSLVGPNGAGKTTAIKIFMNLLAASSGQAEVLALGPTLAVLLERQHRASLDPFQIGQEFRLTRRQTEALGLLMQGYTTRQIARRMEISPNTAKSFLRSIMFKTHACDRSGILARVMQAFDLCKGLEPQNETHNHLDG